MANPPDSEQSPPWADASLDITEDRKKAWGALSMLQRQFEILSGPGRDDREDTPVLRLAAVFDTRSSRAIEALAGKLLNLLFERPEEYLVGDETKSFYLVQHLSKSVSCGSLSREFSLVRGKLTKRFLARISVTGFLGTWTKEAWFSAYRAERDSRSTSPQTLCLHRHRTGPMPDLPYHPCQVWREPRPGPR